MTIRIRPGQAQDQATIKQMVHGAHLNPMDLDWQHFLIAEEEDNPSTQLSSSGSIVGIGQIKSHNDGTRELSSLIVVLERRKQGIGRMLVRALLEHENGTVYLMCHDDLESYYMRFGFTKIERAEMPSFFQMMHRMAALFEKMGRPAHLMVMKRLPTVVSNRES